MISLFYKENRMIPSDLRKEALDLQKNVDWKDEGADGKFQFFQT